MRRLLSALLLALAVSTGCSSGEVDVSASAPKATSISDNGLDSETAALIADGKTSEIDASRITVDQFYDDSVLPERYRISWARENLREIDSSEKRAGFFALLQNDRRVPAYAELVGEPSVDDTGDEIAYLQSYYLYIISLEDNPDYRAKLVSAVASKSNSRFHRLQEQLGSGQEPITGTFNVGRFDAAAPAQETSVFRTTAVLNYVPNGIPSKLMKIKNTDTTLSSSIVYSEVIVKFEEGQWVTVDSISENDEKWVMRPQEMKVE